MSTVIPFAFGDALLRCVVRDGNPWFVAADVCRALDIKQPTQACENLDDDEKGVYSTHTLGGVQDVLIVSESGFYTIVLRSRQATTPGSVAHRFRKWVTSEVLPSLRRTGTYTAPARRDVTPAQPPAPRVLSFDPIPTFLEDYGRIDPDPRHVDRVAQAVLAAGTIALSPLQRKTPLMTAHQRNAAIAELARRGEVTLAVAHGAWGRPSILVASV